MAHVAKLPDLEILSLKGTKITDAGLAALSQTPMINWLKLTNTKVTDAGLLHLAALKTLERVAVSEGSGVTEAGMARLREALPKAKVVYSKF